MADKRNFALRDAEGNETSVFAGTAPRQAALKAATRGFTDIRLREKGTKKVHVFQGERKLIQRPKKAPAWMPKKIWKPSVKKIGIQKLEEI
ncbi:MAG: Chromosomal protein MC1c [Methanosaeta sp. PtaU1.Bin112]|nr:MAG: Chromosomal protein MC1c [Methanosaeta sp. PtaU1.Bin112]